MCRPLHHTLAPCCFFLSRDYELLLGVLHECRRSSGTLDGPVSIQALSKYLDVGHPVSVFADVTDTINAGSVPERSVVGSNIILYIGEGVMRKSRAQVVDRDDGVAVEVCLAPVRTCIPDLTDPHQVGLRGALLPLHCYKP